MKDNTNIRHAIVSTDIVIFAYKDSSLYTVLMDVKNEEYKGQVAFPGALILPEETAKDSVKRVIETKLGLNDLKIYIEEFGAYSDIDRDVRGRVVSIAFYGLANYDWLEKQNNSNYKITEVKKVKKLAYDHNKILRDGEERLKEKFSNSTIAQKLLGEEFTMTELFNLYKTVLEKDIDKRNFVKKVKTLDILKESGGVVKGQKHRPAKLIEFKEKRVKQLEIF